MDRVLVTLGFVFVFEALLAVGASVLLLVLVKSDMSKLCEAHDAVETKRYS